MKKSKIIGFLAESIAATVMASLGLFVRHISVDIQIIAFARLGIGLLLLFIQIVLSKKLHQIKQTKISAPLVLSGFFLALAILSYIKAIKSTTLINAVFLLYLAPIIAMVLAAIWLKEKLKLVNFLLLVLAFGGFLFILEFQVSLNWQDYLGYFWGILAAIFYSLFIIFNRKIDSKIPTSIRSLYQLLWGMITILPFMFWTKIDWVEPADLYWLIGVGFLHGYLALTLMITAIQRLEVYEYGTISYLEPMVATLLGVFVYSETVSFWQAIGCLMIFVAGVKQVFLTRNN
ncbi:MAG: DMT family transporter [Pleurocapsa sp. MO_192.B19]|nr:DMT family transporter [Pleurocapsa sp. MO_192.B19]